jgi:hypothetical protein
VLNYMQKAKRYLWAFVEIGFLTILSVILIYLILGDTSGVFVTGVAANVLKFAGALPAQSLVGLAIVLALVILLSNRMSRQVDAAERSAGELRRENDPNPRTRHDEPRTDEAPPATMPNAAPSPQAEEA